QVASLLEVGAGFHLELTGRENIFLNGAILGMSRTQIKRKFDSIVAFAEVERFLDTPIKRYSSGMYVRLAFSIAAHMEPDILLVDEVLAVGDAAFQKKCLDKMKEVARKSGRTVLLVSHDIRAIKELCTRGIWLDGGCLIEDGLVEEVAAHYLENILERGFETRAGGSGDGNRFRVERVILKNRHGLPTTMFHPGESMTVEIHYTSPRRYDHPLFWVRIKSQYSSLFEASMLLDGNSPAWVEGEGVLECTFRHLPLLPQTYFVNIEARASDGITVLVPSQEVGFFMIAGREGHDNQENEMSAILADNFAPVMLPYEWRLSNDDPLKWFGKEGSDSINSQNGGPRKL
ncbi:MAG TPA: Wzt carbohydrate-binding domain-containing protein, partial [Chthonomonadales bacterium]|nr:Wzt carbohydrate-binding domain-containing protein [Chthonomonadales bacterium]